MAALANPAILADDAAEALELAGKLTVEIDNLVEGLRDLAVHAVEIFGEPHGKVAAPEGAQRRQYLTAVKLIGRCNSRQLCFSPGRSPSRGATAPRDSQHERLGLVPRRREKAGIPGIWPGGGLSSPAQFHQEAIKQASLRQYRLSTESIITPNAARTCFGQRKSLQNLQNFAVDSQVSGEEHIACHISFSGRGSV